MTRSINISQSFINECSRFAHQVWTPNFKKNVSRKSDDVVGSAICSGSIVVSEVALQWNDFIPKCESKMTWDAGIVDCEECQLLLFHVRYLRKIRQRAQFCVMYVCARNARNHFHPNGHLHRVKLNFHFHWRSIWLANCVLSGQMEMSPKNIPRQLAHKAFDKTPKVCITLRNGQRDPSAEIKKSPNRVSRVSTWIDTCGWKNASLAGRLKPIRNDATLSNYGFVVLIAAITSRNCWIDVFHSHYPGIIPRERSGGTLFRKESVCVDLAGIAYFGMMRNFTGKWGGRGQVTFFQFYNLYWDYW